MTHRPAGLRNALWQALAFGMMGVAVFLLLRNTSANLHARGIASGFAFLDSVARVPVANASLAFETGIDTYGRALVIGVVNTLKISLVAAVVATIIGVFVGAGRLSPNPLVRAVCTAYVEIMRNVPVLLHILMWYQVILSLPGPADAWTSDTGVLLSNRGLFLPSVGSPALAGWTAAILIAVAVFRFTSYFRGSPGGPALRRSSLWHGLWLLALLPWALAAKLPVLELPAIDGLDVVGGLSMSPEYAALLVGIATYTASFIAEIVRASILSVPRGQWEAASAIGLSGGRVFRRIVMPQALRVAIPPATSEYLGILKNSSLAFVIGYQDVVAMGNSILFETGQAIEVIGLVMAFYVLASLAISGVMDVINRRTALVEG